jgi:hypothetical protein
MSSHLPDALGVVMATASASSAMPLVIAFVVVVLLIVGIHLVITKVFDLIDQPSARELRRIDRDRDAAVREMIAIRQDATRRMQNIADEDVIEGRVWDR